MATITISVQSLLNTSQFNSYTVSDGITVDTLKTTINSNIGTDSSWYNVNFNQQVLDDSSTLASNGIVDGSVLGTGNVIAYLPTLEQRQISKLNLATLNRQQVGNPYDTYDIELLPSRYVGNVSTPNPHPNGLVLGRPWLPYNPGAYQTNYSGYWNNDVTYFNTASVLSTQVASNFTIPSETTTTSVQYLGYIKADYTDTWTFSMGSDDGAMLWIGDNAVSGYTSSNALIVSNNSTASGTIAMVSGYFYPVRLMYGNNGGPGSLNVTYAHTGQSATNDFTGKLFYNTLTNGL
jgi:hypothetical protein